MAGLYSGSLTVGELLEHGDLGLGTLDSIDGELIVLDGKAYQAKGAGEKPEVVEEEIDSSPGIIPKNIIEEDNSEEEEFFDDDHKPADSEYEEKLPTGGIDDSKFTG